MSGEHHSLCHKGVQVFPNKYNAIALPGDNKLASSPSAASQLHSVLFIVCLLHVRL